jgi:hypothetical protein
MDGVFEAQSQRENLTDVVVRLGHDVTLFASGDSVSSAHTVPCAAMALRLDAYRAADYVTELRQRVYISAVTLGQLASDSL